MRTSLRTVLAASMVGAVALAGGAVAAPAKPKPVCNLINDEKDDTFALRSQDAQGAYGPQEDALDIVSGDLASDGKVLTAVLRVKKMALSTGSSPTGLSFRVQFTHGGLDEDTNLFLSGRASGTNQLFTPGSRAITANLSTKLADVKGVFDVAKSEVRITRRWTSSRPSAAASRSARSCSWPSSTRPPRASSRSTRPRAPTRPPSLTTSASSYTVGAPSCVVPGK